MKCLYCSERAGFLKRRCRDCLRLEAALQTLSHSFGYRELLDTLLATGIDSQKIERFLDADPDGTGSLNDRVTARMTNEIMAGLGQPSHMTASSVKEVRKGRDQP